MCGIAGLLGASARDAATLARMSGTIDHRGPDDEGIWADEEAGIGLAHRRLAIVDLSPAGHQPMVSSDGRWVLSFNGEIYNHVALRGELESAQLAPASWRGRSDTETLIEGIVGWGLVATLEKCVGMFALALWDRRDRQLHLARDRFGEKPLYYGWVGGDFLFGSELKALRSHAGFDNPVERQAVQLLASRGYIPAPLSIYRYIFKLEPGCILTASPRVARNKSQRPPFVGECGRELSLTRYWSYRDVVLDGLAEPIEDEREALDALEQALAEAIRGQAEADVPVGAFLSGGIDSSTVVALYQKYAVGAVRTFSIGFEQAGYDEAKEARRVAEHFRTDHHEMYVTAGDARDVIPLLPAIYDEPFADSSQIPTYLVSKFARDQVTVALTGDGGDELFAGYNRHVRAPPLWNKLARIPRPLRRVAGEALARLPAPLWNGASRLVGGTRSGVGSKVQKALRIGATAGSIEDIYGGFLDEWDGQLSPVRGAGRLPGFDLDLGAGVPDAVRLMHGDAVGYLPDDILCKVDRASMAVSLETRVPFLDHRVAALAARIPLDLKVRGGVGKHILRELLYREAPRALFERPKAGFAVPVGEWIKGPLRPWAEELLEPVRMGHEGWFDPTIVQCRWRDHLSGRRSSTSAIWAILMFQAWLRRAK